MSSAESKSSFLSKFSLRRKKQQTEIIPQEVDVVDKPALYTIRSSPTDMRGPSVHNGGELTTHSSGALGLHNVPLPTQHSAPTSPNARPATLAPEHRSPKSSRHSTSPLPSTVTIPLPRVHKRLIVCCDGTWQDGISQRQRWMYSNVLKLSRCVSHEDTRHQPPIQQIVLYQSGLGSENNIISHLVDGAFGAHLAEKVQEAYAFLSQNYHAGDEIFLFGFSRGAYTARMVATFVGEIGMLSRSDMDKFADIFIAYQKRSKADDIDEIAKYDAFLAPFRDPNSPGKIRMAASGDFKVKVVGVFDTVGALGLPAEFTIGNTKAQTLFNFPDKILGEHVERAYHAMALDEERQDFDVTKFHQTAAGRAKGQVLKQVWFSGMHGDIGGGWQDHDLSDLSLGWMIANVEDSIAFDHAYLISLHRPVQPWGVQLPHYSKKGIFALSRSIRRKIEPPAHVVDASIANSPPNTVVENTGVLQFDDAPQSPSSPNVKVDADGKPIPKKKKSHHALEPAWTNERVHSSVLKQSLLDPTVQDMLNKRPDIVEERLLPLEEEIRKLWRVVRVPSSSAEPRYSDLSGDGTYTVPSRTPTQIERDEAQAELERKSHAKQLEAFRNAARKATKKTVDLAEDMVLPGRKKEKEEKAAGLWDGNEETEVDPRNAFSRFEESSMGKVWEEIVGGITD